MAKQGKVELLGCVKIVADGIGQNKSLREIAQDCSNFAGEPVSYTSIRRYLESKKNEEQKEKKEVIVQDRRRVLKVVNQELDIIQLQYETTEELRNHFQLLGNLGEMFETSMNELLAHLITEDDEYKDYLTKWEKHFSSELKRKIVELTSLNRELRENSKFLAEIRAKAFSFSLVQEYLALFMQRFKEESKDGAFERTLQWISANPRMQQIVDQQRSLLSDS